jgi:hypothetical protein
LCYWLFHAAKLLEFTVFTTKKSDNQDNDFLNIPNVICNSSFHRWRHAQRLMNPAKIVIHEVERDVIAGQGSIYGRMTEGASIVNHKSKM